LKEKLIAKGNQACVAYYHQCTDWDDWGTLNEHWVMEHEESPAKGYMNRWYTRTKPDMKVHDRDNRPGSICVTFLNGAITPDIEWSGKPTGHHADPRENYQHKRDLEREQEIASKPEGYGKWA
jgi:hypothetical protein